MQRIKVFQNVHPTKNSLDEEWSLDWEDKLDLAESKLNLETHSIAASTSVQTPLQQKESNKRNKTFRNVFHLLTYNF